MTHAIQIDAARERLTTWWNGGDIGRPILHMATIRRPPAETIPALPEPDGRRELYDVGHLACRVNRALRFCAGRECHAEYLPSVRAGLGLNDLALFLGCQGHMQSGTLWVKPCIGEPDNARLVYDRDNPYWKCCQEEVRRLRHDGRDSFRIEFPNMLAGLDTLEAMRGGERLLVDLYDRPEWVHTCLRNITDLYFHYYDILYDMIRDEVGGSVAWCWAPGRTAVFQCDMSIMLSPDMFEEFMLPVLTEMCERVSYSIYHLDGVGALHHHKALLTIPNLKMIQWEPGAEQPPPDDPCWWPLYHRTVDAGKKVLARCGDIDSLAAMRREFGGKLKQFLISVKVTTAEEADAAVRTAMIE